MATRWGIIGTSNISHDFVVAVNTLSRTEHLVTAVASRDTSRSQEFAEQFEIPKAYGSYLLMANDPEVGKIMDFDIRIFCGHPSETAWNGRGEGG